jgi:hypothetical protein
MRRIYFYFRQTCPVAAYGDVARPWLVRELLQVGGVVGEPARRLTKAGRDPRTGTSPNDIPGGGKAASPVTRPERESRQEACLRRLFARRVDRAGVCADGAG